VSAFCDSTGGWLASACVPNCALPLEWARGLFGLDHGGFDALVATVPAGARGLTFIPYLDSERTPNRPGAAGELRGLRAAHGPAEISRSALEGVTAGLAHAFRAFERTGVAADGMLLVGGGAQSGTWGPAGGGLAGSARGAARGAALQVVSVVDGVPVPRPSAIEARREPPGHATAADAAAPYVRLILEGAA